MLSSVLKWLVPWLNSCTVRNITTNPLRFYGRRFTGDIHRISNFEKRLLVWMGKYKKIEDVPSFVAPEIVQKLRSRMRIHIANIMILSTIVGCVVMIYSGKKAHERGESIQQYNLDWHKKYNEEYATRHKLE